MSVRCITMLDRSGTYYIPLDCIRILVTNPDIQIVPHTDAHIAGISYYEGDIVTYFRLGHGQTNRKKNEDECGISCGIILRKDKYCFGICATGILDEAVLTEEELENQRIEILKTWESAVNINDYD